MGLAAAKDVLGFAYMIINAKAANLQMLCEYE
jgi:hypothetical protein